MDDADVGIERGRHASSGYWRAAAERISLFGSRARLSTESLQSSARWRAEKPSPVRLRSMLL